MKTKRVFLIWTLLICISTNLIAQVHVITADMIKTTSTTTYAPIETLNFSTYSYIGKSIRSATYFQLSDLPKYESGIVTNKSTGKLKSISIEWDESNLSGTEIWIHGKNTPYTSSKELCDPETQGKCIAIIKVGNTETIHLNEEYQYIGIRACVHQARINKLSLNWEKNKQKIYFENPNAVIYINDKFAGNPLCGAKTDVTYSSSDPSVATVNETDGTISINNTGTTTISAMAQESQAYSGATAQYQLVVLPRTSQTASFDMNAPQNLTPHYGPTEKVNTSLCFIDKDITISVRNPKPGPNVVPIQFYTQDNRTYLYMPKDGGLIMDTPAGLIIKNITVESHLGKFEFPTQKSHYELNMAKEHYIKSIAVEYAGDYKFRMNAHQHATFSGHQAYIMPQGLCGATISLNTDKNIAKAKFSFQPGDMVSPSTALLLKGEPGEYTLRTGVYNGQQPSTEENLLRPVLTNNPITAQPGQQLFIFANAQKGLGFYWQKGSTSGDGVKNIKNKAYLDLPTSLNASSAGFRLEMDEATGISPLDCSTNESGLIYTLTGIPVHTSRENLPKGIYLIKGKKVMVK